ncbi:alginate biosynthesis protein AlgZ/FimS [Jeongeupia chitinilytica]|uniref:Alginate biosynthesis protein AlgZ/FimS n=1 Tax=Jeongeupia chitinilytica TaxID=1041641 RepID=A0ABQ3H2C6_9NEIS|nr:alginate biosynthesis protein AlgZ/FimS [Jeongeupia chitinilytica]
MLGPLSAQTVIDELPDFRSPSVMLHALVYSHLLLLLHTLADLPRWAHWSSRVAGAAIWVELVLLPSLAILAGLAPTLARLPYRLGVFIVCTVTVGCGWIGRVLLMPIQAQPNAQFAPELMILLSTLGFLWLLQMRHRALVPRLAEARLSALQARIRPHFFFNSLNAVLSLIRYEPAKAEEALQDIADLFRVVMKDNRKLARLVSEVEVAERYLNIEMIRLGNRLQVDWQIDDMPENAAVPPLVLQPLLENAIYYGVEPLLEPPPIQIRITQTRDRVHLIVRNALPSNTVRVREGNGMALENIRERLLLHFDTEASLTTEAGSDYYQVHILLPYREILHDDAAAPFSRR